MNNVGSIEIIALRCKTDLDDVPPAKRATSSNKQDMPSRSAPPKPKSAAKVASPPQSELGGLFGLFDGACDGMNFDGAGDRRPVEKDGRVRFDPPPGMEWDSFMGEFRPASDIPSAHGRRDFGPEAMHHARAVEGNHPQLDGYEGPGVVINQWGGRGRDDLHGDKYFGLQGKDRRVYKEILRRRGDPVSEASNVVPVEDAQHAYVKPEYPRRVEDLTNRARRYDPNDGGLQQCTIDIQTLEQAIRDFEYANPNANLKPAHHKLAQMKGIQARLRTLLGQTKADEKNYTQYATPGYGMQTHRGQPNAGQGPYPVDHAWDFRPAFGELQGRMRFEDLPIPLQDKLLDIDVMRQAALQFQQQNPRVDLSPLMVDLGRKQFNALRNTDLHRRKPFGNNVQDMEELYDIIDERRQDLERFYDGARQSDKNFRSKEMEERIRKVISIGETTYSHLQKLERDAEQADQQDGHAGAQGANQDAQVNQAPHGGGDASFAGGAPSANPYRHNTFGHQADQLGNQRGFRPMGIGVWDRGQPTPHYEQQPAQGHGWQQDQGQQNVANDDWRRGGGPAPDTFSEHGSRLQPTYQGAPAARANQPQFGNQWNDNNQQDRPPSQLNWGANAGSQKAQEPFYPEASQNDGGQPTGNPNDDWAQVGEQNAQGDSWGGEQNKQDGGWGGEQNNQDTSWGDDQNNQDGGWGADQAPEASVKSGAGWGSKPHSKKASDTGWEAVSKQNKDNGGISAGARCKDADPSAYVKPYWKDWNRPPAGSDVSDSNTKKKRDQPREVYLYPAMPLQPLPSNKAKDASHGVQTGRGADYSHKTRKPTYIDTMESPYAVFSFKYRSKPTLEKILKLKVDEVEVSKVKEQIEKDKYMSMPKHKLIEELLNRRGPQKGASSAKGGAASDKGGSGWGAKPAGNGGGDAGWGTSGDDGGNDHGGNGWGGNEGGSHHSTRSRHSQSWGVAGSKKNDNAGNGWDTTTPANNGNGWDDTSPAAAGGWDGQNEHADKAQPDVDHANGNRADSSKTLEHFSGGLCDTEAYHKEGGPGYGRKSKGNAGLANDEIKWEMPKGMEDAGNMAKYMTGGQSKW